MRPPVEEDMLRSVGRLPAQVPHRQEAAPAHAFHLAAAVDAPGRERRAPGLEKVFDEFPRPDRGAFGEVPQARPDEHAAGELALLAVDDQVRGLGREAALDDLAVFVEDGGAFFIQPPPPIHPLVEGDPVAAGIKRQSPISEMKSPSFG